MRPLAPALSTPAEEARLLAVIAKSRSRMWRLPEGSQDRRDEHTRLSLLLDQWEFAFGAGGEP